MSVDNPVKIPLQSLDPWQSKMYQRTKGATFNYISFDAISGFPLEPVLWIVIYKSIKTVVLYPYNRFYEVMVISMFSSIGKMDYKMHFLIFRYVVETDFDTVVLRIIR